MLIYLSSYPRSGNTWVRNLLRHYFGYRSTSLYLEPNGTPNLDRRPDGTFDLFSFYELPQAPGSRLPLLVNNCGQILDERLRQKLGAAEEPFFLKTHELPFERYFEGEYVVHLVREPGAVCWSYFNYLRKNEGDQFAQITLDDVIEGKAPFGSWGAHTRAWLAAGEQLGARFWLHKYEDIAGHPETEFVDGLAALTGLTYRMPKKPLAPLEKWHQQEPDFYRKEKESRWKRNYSAAQLYRVLELNGSVIQQLGYDSAAYTTSLRKRLLSMVLFGGKTQKSHLPGA
jgi:Sulfotransferase domain